MGNERGQSQLKEAKRRERHTYIMVPDTCIIPGTTAVCSKERTAPHDTALQNEGAGGALFVIQQRNMYKSGVVLI